MSFKLMVLLQCLSLSAFAMPLISEPELSPATSQLGRLKVQSNNFRRWNHLVTLTDSKSAGTVTEAPRLYSTYRGLSCRDINLSKNSNVEDPHDKNMQDGNKRRQIVADNKAIVQRIGKTATIQQQPESSSNIYIYIDGKLDQKRASWRWSCLFLFVTIMLMVVLLTLCYYFFDIGLYYVNPELSDKSSVLSGFT